MISGTYSRGTKYTCAAVITFSDNTTKTLSESDFATGNNGFVDGAGANVFPLGLAIARSISIEILNDGSYENKTFIGAVIQLSAKYGNNTIAIGKFTVIEPETYGETIIITAVDDMFKTDKPYTTSLTFPVTLQALFNDACISCGIANGSSSFSHNDFQVSGIESGKYTFREIFGFIAMIAGGNARVNRNGQMQILSYGLSATPSVKLQDWQSLKTDYNDVTITGLKAVAGEGDESQTYSYGNAGYMLELKNPFFTDDNAQTALSYIAATVVNKSFRKFEGDHVAFPFAEFMDVVYIVDRKGNQYKTVITDVDFTFFGATTLKNSAESALRNESYYVSGNTKTLISAQKAVQRETTARESAIAQLQQALANASGMYATDVTQPDQSVIRYLHDKPTLAASTNILKITNEAIAISKDGGSTYPYGVTFDGNFIANILSASGVNADWINTGSLVVRNNQNVVFEADVDTGTVVINGSNGNVSFENCPFVIVFSKTYQASSYNLNLSDPNNDLNKILDFINGESIPTQADIAKFDLNANGKIDDTDLSIFSRFAVKHNNVGVTSMNIKRYIEITPVNTTKLLRTHILAEFSDGSKEDFEGTSLTHTGIQIPGRVYSENYIEGDIWSIGGLSQAPFGGLITSDARFKVDNNFDVSGSSQLHEVQYLAAPNWTTPAIYESICTINGGGYAQLGKLVYVQISLSTNNDIQAGSRTLILYGFPTAEDMPVALSACCYESKSVSCFIENNGWSLYLITHEDLPANSTIYITGSYWIS